MRKIIVAVLLSGPVLAGCGSGDGDGAAEGERPPPSAQPSGTLVVEAAGGEDLKDRTAFLNALRQIDPRLVSNEEKAVGIARNLCRELEKGTPPVAVAAQAAVHYSGNGYVVDITPSKQITKALQQHACP